MKFYNIGDFHRIYYFNFHRKILMRVFLIWSFTQNNVNWRYLFQVPRLSSRSAKYFTFRWSARSEFFISFTGGFLRSAAFSSSDCPFCQMTRLREASFLGSACGLRAKKWKDEKEKITNIANSQGKQWKKQTLHVQNVWRSAFFLKRLSGIHCIPWNLDIEN